MEWRVQEDRNASYGGIEKPFVKTFATVLLTSLAPDSPIWINFAFHRKAGRDIFKINDLLNIAPDAGKTKFRSQTTLRCCQGSSLGRRKVDLHDRNEHPRESSSSTAKEQKTTSDHTGTRNFISTNQRDLRKPTKARRGGEYGLCICVRFVGYSSKLDYYDV